MLLEQKLRCNAALFGWIGDSICYNTTNKIADSDNASARRLPMHVVDRWQLLQMAVLDD
jgi:hypothetical protein